MDWLRRYGLVLGWLVLLGLMVFTSWRDPLDTTAPGYPNGQNHPGDFWRTAIFSLAELGVLYAILRPWSYRRAWPRALAALAVGLPWTVVYLAISMHAGSITAAHGLWLIAMDALLMAVLVVSTASRIRAVWHTAT